MLNVAALGLRLVSLQISRSCLILNSPHGGFAMQLSLMPDDPITISRDTAESLDTRIRSLTDQLAHAHRIIVGCPLLRE